MRNLNEEITFIDTFSGVGGGRLGLERADKRYRCVWSCDQDQYANWVYTKNFPRSLHYSGDIRGVDPQDIPDFDLLCAGFPCQSFSVAGKRHGLEDTRGTLFFEICRIALAKRPSWILLENVRGLLSHDEGLTFQIILESLEELGYWSEWEVLNSLDFGVPQHRERVFIIGHLRDRCRREVFPIPKTSRLVTGEDDGGRGEYSSLIDSNYWKGPDKHGQRTMIAVETAHRTANMTEGRFSDYSHALDGSNSKGVIQLNQRREVINKEVSGTIHAFMGNNQAPKVITPRHGTITEYSPTLTKCMEKDHYKVIDRRQSRREDESIRDFDDKSPTLTSSMYKEPPIVLHRIRESAGELRTYENNSPTLPTPAGGGHLPELILGSRIRKFTPLECERLQGFPDGWTDPLRDGSISDTQRYKMLGNAMTVNVIEYLGKRMMETIFND